VTEPTTNITEALQWVQEDWSEERLHRGRVALERASVRRRRARGVAAVGVAGLAVAATLVAFVWPRSSVDEALAAVSPIGTPADDASGREDAPGALRFQDGSVAIPLGTDTAMATSLDEPNRAGLELLGGAARFDVVPRPSRAFDVSVGSVRVSVLGTRFDVRRQARHVLVHVLRGRVRVQWLGGERVLTATQSGLFPLELGGAAEGAGAQENVEGGAVTDGSDLVPPDEFDMNFALDGADGVDGVDRADAFTEGAPELAEVLDGAGEAPRHDPRDWRTMARAGRYDDAYEAARGATVGSSMNDLMLAADTARLTRHLDEAVTHLERALALHPGDRRAYLAAFTLGRVSLQQGQPQRAARAFARAQQLDTRGVMLEAALAREVQALARAGARDAAQRRARVYLQRFPSGRHAGSVRVYADLP
jgi:TolA-binding protein